MHTMVAPWKGRSRRPGSRAMLQSKFHRPWQPRMSSALPLTSFSHGPESQPDSTTLEEFETEREVASQHVIQDRAEFTASAETSLPVSPPELESRRRWYASLIEKLSRH